MFKDCSLLYQEVLRNPALLFLLSERKYCTVASGACALYWNPMLCERLAGRTRILLKQKGIQEDFVKYLPVFLKQTIDYIYIRFLTTM